MSADLSPSSSVPGWGECELLVEAWGLHAGDDWTSVNLYPGSSISAWPEVELLVEVSGRFDNDDWISAHLSPRSCLRGWADVGLLVEVCGKASRWCLDICRYIFEIFHSRAGWSWAHSWRLRATWQWWLDGHRETWRVKGTKVSRHFRSKMRKWNVGREWRWSEVFRDNTHMNVK